MSRILTIVTLLASALLTGCAQMSPMYGAKQRQAFAKEAEETLPVSVTLSTVDQEIILLSVPDDSTTGLYVPAHTVLVADAFDGEFWRVVPPAEAGASGVFYLRARHAAKSADAEHYVSLVERGYGAANPFNRRLAASGTLYRGPRGGCYYLSDSGGKVYVDRALCSGLDVAATPGSTYTPSSGSTGGPVQVRGYTRRDGTYVRPHTRSRPRRN